jgi:membrane protein implicated in regulation of membrane protease activity
VLLGVEIMTPGGFYLLFFGSAALVIGAIVGLGVIETVWVQWLLFSLLSIVSLLLFRGPLLAKIKSHEREGQAVDSLVGEVAILLEDLSPGKIGKAELRGTAWNVRNAGKASLTKGQRSRVERVEGLTLWIKAD